MNFRKMLISNARKAMLDNIEALDKKTLQKELKKSLQEQFRLNNIIDDKKERQDIAIRLLQKLFGTDDYEINYIIGIINGQRQIKFNEELKEDKE